MGADGTGKSIGIGREWIMAQIFGHRGASAYAPENTMAAYRLAQELGAHGVEIDVQCAKDGEVVVLHDAFLDRVSNGRGYVWEYTVKELKALDFGIHFPDRYAGEQIPTLDEVLDFIAHSPMALNIEIKSSPYRYDQTLVKKIHDKVTRYGKSVSEKIILSSFDHRCLREYRLLNPQMPLGLLYSANLYLPGDYAAAVGAQAIHPHYQMIDAQGVRNCKERGIQINTWTVDDPADIKRMLVLGCDRIITNRPDVGLSCL